MSLKIGLQIQIQIPPSQSSVSLHSTPSHPPPPSSPPSAPLLILPLPSPSPASQYPLSRNPLPLSPPASHSHPIPLSPHSLTQPQPASVPPRPSPPPPPQVEPKDVAWGGQPVELGRLYRLKHVLTDLYLTTADPEDGALCLTADYLRDDCLWLLEGIEGGRRARVGGTTPLYLRHHRHKAWLQETPSGPACVAERDPTQYLMLVPSSRETAQDLDHLRAFHMALEDFAEGLQVWGVGGA